MHQRRPSALALLLLLSLGAGACRGVPIATMWRLRSFGPGELAALDPGAIRAAIELPESLAPRSGATVLDVMLDGPRVEPRRFAMPLRTIERGAEVGGLPASKRGRTWFVLALSPEGHERFAELQALMRADAGAYEDVTISVAASFEDLPADPPASATVDIRLRLEADEAFFRLYEGEVSLQPRD